VVGVDGEYAGGVGECAPVDKCMLEWDGDSAVGEDEDAIHFCGEGDLYASGNVAGGVGAEVGAVGDFWREVWCVRSKVQGREPCGWLWRCAYSRAVWCRSVESQCGGALCR
jgi:hypothetical protein